MRVTILGVLTILSCLGTEFLPVAYAAENEESDEFFGLGFLDVSQEYATNSVNAIASQLDQFFGVPRSDLEAAYSSLRLTVENSWTPQNDFDSKVKLRGKIHLPRVNKRFSLIFSEDDGDIEAYNQNQQATLDSNRNTQLNLQVNLKEADRNRMDFRVGLSSSFKARTSLRYRYQRALGKKILTRFTQIFSFKDGTGFGASLRHQLDKNFSDSDLIRLTNDFQGVEGLSGANWKSELAYLTRRSDQTAVSYFSRFNGNTAQGFVSAYEVGMRFRKNISRPWLFIEIEPGYSLYKESDRDKRYGEGFLFLRIQLAVGKYK